MPKMANQKEKKTISSVFINLALANLFVSPRKKKKKKLVVIFLWLW
jgi:hypothetical protein